MNRTRPLLIGLFVACLLAVSLGGLQSASTSGAPPERVTITLLGTTDVHGNIYPVDYYADRPANRGLAKIATLVKQIRAEQPNVLLLDSGDTIQGTPLAFYFARKDTTQPNPTIAVMNAMGYAAMATGNHEFNFGLVPLMKAKREAQFPFLAANLRWSGRKSGVEYFQPYIIRRIAGIRVGIVGFITPGVPRWEVPANYKGYTFEPIVETAKRIIPKVRKQVDLLVVIAHSGLEREAPTGGDVYPDVANENVMGGLASSVPGIDVILYGHTHQELPEKIVNGVLLVQAKNWAQSLVRADVTLERSGAGKWRVASKHSTTLPVTDAVTPDPEILALAKPWHEATQAYLDAPLAESAAAMDGSTARYEDHPFVDLIHKVQMEYGQADVSMATMFLTTARVPAGKVTVRQLASLYIYENTLYTVEMTGAQIRDALEHAAGFYPAWPPKEGERLKLPGYNADCAQGVNYVVDLRQPVGQRIRDLTYKGAPLDPAVKLRVAVNNYRYAGGGQYKVYQGLPIVYRSPQEVRDLMIESVGRTKTVPTQADNNWKIVPREAVEAMIREATTPRDARPSGAALAAPAFRSSTQQLLRAPAN